MAGICSNSPKEYSCQPIHISSMFAISEKWLVAEFILHKVNLCTWDVRIFIKYSWQSLGQSGCFGENIKFSNVTLKGNPCCLEDELRNHWPSTYAHMYTCLKKHSLFRFSKKQECSNYRIKSSFWIPKYFEYFWHLHLYSQISMNICATPTWFPKYL